MSDIRSDYSTYSINGLVSGTKNPTAPSGNAVLYSAQKLYILKMNNDLKDSDLQEFKDAIIKNCQIIPGLICRAHNWVDQEGPDDYVGLAAASKLFDGPSFASQILNYGQMTRYVPFPNSKYFSWVKFKYYYENEDPYNKSDIRAWLGRQPQLIAHFLFANNEKPSLLRKLWWLAAVTTGGINDKDDHDSRILSWLLLETMDQHSLICHLAKAIWTYRLKREWGTLRQVFEKYFNDTQHPTAKYCKL